MRTSGDQLSPGAVDLAMPQSGNPLQISLAALNCSSVHGSHKGGRNGPCGTENFPCSHGATL